MTAMPAFADPDAIPVSALTAGELVRVTADTDLLTAARRMADEEVGALVVASGDDVTGIVSERDVVRAVAAGRVLAETTVGEVASTSIVWCDATASVHEVAEEMMTNYVRHVLVEDGGKVVGITSARDLLGAYAAAEREGVVGT
jgi:CBS domain-containing protein